MDMPTRKAIDKSPDSVYTGIAAADVDRSSGELAVICPELLPNSPYGTVGAGITTGTTSLQDRDGGAISSTITSANHLVCTWDGKSNQRYSPLVRKGEPVQVYRKGDQDKYYWKETGRGRDFRTTDRLHMEVGATDPSKPGVTKNDTNTYSAYLDSDGKKVGIKTSQANGEAMAFTMEADLAAGTFYMTDNGADPANRIFLDTGSKSGSPTFQVNLSDGSTFKMSAGSGFIKLPKGLQVDCGERMVFNSPATVFNTDQKGIIVFNAANVAFNTAKDVIFTLGGVMGINAASVKISGVLIAGSARILKAVQGTLGSLYKASTVSPAATGTPTAAVNAADTNMTGPEYIT